MSSVIMSVCDNLIDLPKHLNSGLKISPMYHILFSKVLYVLYFLHLFIALSHPCFFFFLLLSWHLSFSFFPRLPQNWTTAVKKRQKRWHWQMNLLCLALLCPGSRWLDTPRGRLTKGQPVAGIMSIRWTGVFLPSLENKLSLVLVAAVL